MASVGCRAVQSCGRNVFLVFSPTSTFALLQLVKVAAVMLPYADNEQYLVPHGFGRGPAF